jgi:hypothetical protein
MGNSGDQYVNGGVNWAAFSLEELVAMVSEKASVPQLVELANDWRETGEEITAAADYLADALDDLMNFWSGESAEQARQTVALNAQWVGDLGATARTMGDPIDEAAGALKSAQEAMPKLPTVPQEDVLGSAPRGADAASAVTGGSQLGAAVGATAAGSESAFQSQAEQEDMKRIAIETMERFEAAAVGIDQATPQFQEQSKVLRPREDTGSDGGDNGWLDKVNGETGVDRRWQALTGGMTDPSATSGQSSGASGDFAFSNGAGSIGAGAGEVGAVSGPVTGRGTTEHVSGVGGARPGFAAAAASGAAAGTSNAGMTGPMAPMGGMGAGGQGDGQQYRRRVPFDGEDPFDTGQQVSKPVIGI